MITAVDVPVASLDAALAAGHLYVVLDACDAPAVPLLCEGLGETHAVSLYRGEAEEEFADIAPYLVHVQTPDVWQWVRDFSRLDPGWGIVLITPATLDELRGHLRRFLKVQGPDGARMYFRFYDPRVLPLFLPTCDVAQLLALYGMVREFAVLTGPEQAQVFRFGRAMERAGAAG